MRTAKLTNGFVNVFETKSLVSNVQMYSMYPHETRKDADRAAKDSWKYNMRLVYRLRVTLKPKLRKRA